MKIEVSDQESFPVLSGIPVHGIARNVCTDLDLNLGSCHIIFSSDETVQKLHQEYFDDPASTDVITFDLGNREIEGELYISADQAIKQSRQYGVTPAEEVSRLIIHGILHLLGFEDVEETDKKQMKKKEEALLDKIKQQLL